MNGEHVRPEVPADLELARADIERLVRRCGLKPGRVVCVMVDSEEMSELAAYGGYPVRYHHYLFGQDSLAQKRRYRWGLSKIYEMVIPTEPNYAYLMENNSRAAQKMVIAHVFGHSDFSENNAWFADVPKNLHDRFAANAERMEDVRNEIGREKVDKFLDYCLSLDNLFDPMEKFTLELLLEKKKEEFKKVDKDRYLDENQFPIYPQEIVDAQQQQLEDKQRLASEVERGIRIPAKPVRDVLGFLLLNAPLEPWQQEVMRIVREETLAFKNIAQTKIMNEGWAAYWHAYIMGELGVADDSEVFPFIKLDAGVIGGRGFNPYKFGYQLWQDIKWRWDTGRHGHLWEDCQEAAILSRWDEFIVFKTLYDKNGGMNDKFFREWEDFSTLVYETRHDRGIVARIFFRPEHCVSEWLNFLCAEVKLQELKSQPLHWSEKEIECEVGRCHEYINLKKKMRDGAMTMHRAEIPDSWVVWAKEHVYNGKLGEGLEKMLEVRAVYNDVNFVQDFFTEDFCRKHKYYTVGIEERYDDKDDDINDHYVIMSREYQRVKQFFINRFLNLGSPRVVLYDANFNNNNELRLIHLQDGRNIDLADLAEVLVRLYEVWGRNKPVHLESMVIYWPEPRRPWDTWHPPGEEPKPDPPPPVLWVRFSFDGENYKKVGIRYSAIEPEVKAMMSFTPRRFEKDWS